MTVVGIGTDICAIARITAVLERSGEQFLHRVLTEAERQGEWTPRKLARRWAIKEAVAKALGCGIGARLSFQDIEVTHDAQGKPQCVVRTFPEMLVHVSASDDRDYATAFAVVETRGSSTLPAVEQCG